MFLFNVLRIVCKWARPVTCRKMKTFSIFKKVLVVSNFQIQSRIYFGRYFKKIKEIAGRIKRIVCWSVGRDEIYFVKGKVSGNMVQILSRNVFGFNLC